MIPTIKQLTYLRALYEEQNFSKAAERCFVTQSTLSAGIKELEIILDEDLVDRTARHTTLTPLGLETLKSADKILNEVDQIMKRAQSAKEPFNLPLRFGVIPTIAPYLLPQILPALKKEFPQLEIQLYEDLTENLLNKLKKREIDVALMAFPYEKDDLEKMVLFEEPFVLAAHKGQFKEKSITLDFLNDKDVLLLEDGHCLRDHALRACKLRSGSQKKTFSATSLATLIQMISHGYGITLLPEMAAHPENLPDNIQLLQFKNPKPTRQIGLAWRRGDPRMRDYEILAKSLSKDYKIIP